MPGHIVPIREHQEVPLYNPDQTAIATSPAQTTIHSIITLAIHQEVILEETADLFNVQIRVVEDKSN